MKAFPSNTARVIEVRPSINAYNVDMVHYFTAAYTLPLPSGIVWSTFTVQPMSKPVLYSTIAPLYGSSGTIQNTAAPK